MNSSYSSENYSLANTIYWFRCVIAAVGLRADHCRTDGIVNMTESQADVDLE